MIITNNKNIINGSNALAPQSIPGRDIQRQRDLERLRKEHQRINREKAINKKAVVLRSILLLFVIGLALIYRYSVIFNMEKDALDIKKQISIINAENESIKIELLKYNNIQLLEEEAFKNLDMIPKSVDNGVYIDLEESNFQNNTKEGEDVSDTLFSKIKKILY